MRTLNARGFTVYELGREDADQIYSILEPKLGRAANKSIQAKKRRVIRREIEFAFKEPEHHIIGIKKDENLVGIATCNDEGGIPWLGHFVIDDKFEKTKASGLLLYYIMGIAYPEKIIQTRPIGDISKYKSSIKKMPAQFDFDIINPERFKLLKKIAGE